MTTSSDGSDSKDSTCKTPHSDFEAGFQRILAYLSEKRYRRWVAYVLIFAIIYAALATVLNYSFSLLLPPFFSSSKSFPSMAALVFYGYASRLVPLAITLLIFLKLHKIYKTR